MQLTNKMNIRPVLPALLVGTLAAIAAQMPLSAATTLSATTMRAVKVVRETVASATAATAWVNVPGATATMTVPAFTTDLFVARFTAESVCYGKSGWCPVRILLNGVEMDPAAGTDFAFDSSDAGTASPSSWESHAVERSRPYTTSTAPITVTIQVQYMVTSPGMTVRLDDWHLTVQQFH